MFTIYQTRESGANIPTNSRTLQSLAVFVHANNPTDASPNRGGWRGLLVTRLSDTKKAGFGRVAWNAPASGERTDAKEKL